MRSYRYISSFILTAIVLSVGCKDPYVSAYKAPPAGYLVVEGYISGNSATQFRLSRTIPLPGDSTLPVETGAAVEVQGSDNSVFPLTDQGGGVYNDTNALPLTTAVTYRLHIKTRNGEEYLSDTVAYRPTPPIDSLSWVQNGDHSVEIYVSTHDPANNTHYYLWNYDQTFEYHSAEESDYYFDKTLDSVLPRTDQVYRCWLSSSSNSIFVASSTKLAKDEIYEQPLKNIPPDDIQLSVLYTILVRQYALTDSAYMFLSRMQKNTESLGSIFDAQPTSLPTNIHCLTNPKEPVIGWVSAGTVQQQRLWISRSQVKTNYAFICNGDDFNVPIDKVSIAKYFDDEYTPVTLTQDRGGAWVWLANFTQCLVCTVRGGTNHAPSYWPN